MNVPIYIEEKKLDINFRLKLISSFLFMKKTMCTLSDAYKAEQFIISILLFI